MVELARELGVSQATCVAGSGLRGADLTDPVREIAGLQELIVLRNILRALGPTVPFALQAGLRYRATMMGTWGFAILTSQSFREAIDVGHRYFELTYSFNRPGFEVVGRQARLLLDGCDNPDDLRGVLVERDMAAVAAMQRDILGSVVPTQQMQLRAPRPAYAHAFEPIFGVVPEWNAPINSLGYDVALLDVAGPFADRLGFGVSEEACRTLLEYRRARIGLAGQVRARILRRPGELADMPSVAAELGMSSRTLRNRLGREGTTFRELVEEVRRGMAEQLLAAKYLTLDQIAERVGYADTSSFIAAFKRWRGVAPGRYRARVPAVGKRR
jgi:AraC-like DNA-binding protein